MIHLSEFVLKYIFRLKVEEVKQVFSKVDLDDYLESLTENHSISPLNSSFSEKRTREMGEGM